MNHGERGCNQASIPGLKVWPQVIFLLDWTTLRTIIAALILIPSVALAEETTPAFDAKAAERFANLALGCVHKEYPNKISHTLKSDADVAPPRKLTPAFYGCYDWHSSVHGHWLLARLVRQFPDAPFSKPAREALKKSLSAENLQKDAGGVWRTEVELPPGTHHYRFIVDGQWTDDPDCTLRVPNPYGGENMVRAVS